MKRLNLAQRLNLISAVLILLLLGTALAVWLMMGQVISAARRISETNAPQLALIGEIELNVTRASLQLRHAILSRNDAELQETLADLVVKKDLLQDRVDRFGQGMIDDSGRQAFEPLPPLMQEFWRVSEQNVALIMAGQRAEAFAFLVEETIPARNRLLAPLAQEKQRQNARLQFRVGEIVELSTLDRALVVGAVLLVAFGLVGLAAYLRSVVRQLGADPEELKRTVDAVASGDLAVEVTVLEGDHASMMYALRQMAQRLEGSVSDVRRTAEQVANASAEIASGNSDLSQRTEQQASALEETSSSMEELGSAVSSNTDHIHAASKLATQASDLALRGQEAVKKVTETMQGIAGSSQQISEITGTIDSIAFQTNILALNAAVEAARAGEQGRGFAVVASEVRNLAQRSAEAAKQIKALIENSTQRVSLGTELVGNAGQAMTAIVTSIQEASVLMGRVSEAGAEQSAGVRQVAEAVSHMDQATQQNAALVEEMAAAAQSLQSQASDLLSAVGQFKTRGDRAVDRQVAAPLVLPWARSV